MAGGALACSGFAAGCAAGFVSAALFSFARVAAALLSFVLFAVARVAAAFFSPFRGLVRSGSSWPSPAALFSVAFVSAALFSSALFSVALVSAARFSAALFSVVFVSAALFASALFSVASYARSAGSTARRYHALARKLSRLGRCRDCRTPVIHRREHFRFPLGSY